MTFDERKKIDVVGLGNALMDLLVEADDETLKKAQLEKGGVHFVDEKKAKEILQELADIELKTVPGGAAANAIKGVASLGGESVLFAKVGEDDHGASYIEAIKLHGVTPRIKHDPAVTGHALTFITPDAERTFSVHLGAALSLGKSDILEEDIAAAKVLHLEAFQFEGPTHDTLLHAIDIAKKHNTRISIDLADSGLIERNSDLFKKVVSEDVDILFCNEEEGKTFTGLEGEAAVVKMGEMVSAAILKLGDKGSLICIDGEILKIDAVKSEAIDTTGAGDMYAAGFLYGYTHGWDVLRSGNLGSALAAQVVAQVGVDIINVDIESIREEVQRV